MTGAFKYRRYKAQFLALLLSYIGLSKYSKSGGLTDFESIIKLAKIGYSDLEIRFLGK